MEANTLSQSVVSDLVVAKSDRTDVVAVVVIDGLSYWDWTKAGNTARPVYVDCPTITECGYPNVVHGTASSQSLAVRLHEKGFTNRLAFTYWQKENNELTKRLHDSFSKNDVVGDIQDFSDVIAYLRDIPLDSKPPTYLQITLTGPERVAHKHKEDPNIESEVSEVERKLHELQSVLTADVPSAEIFATADHGILWRMDAGEDFRSLEGEWDHHDRRCLIDPPVGLDLPSDHGRNREWGGTDYFQLEYPYLFHSLRSNEPGTHGGFSFQESLVPLIRLN